MKESKENSILPSTERTPNPSYNEQDFYKEVKKDSQSNINSIQKNLDIAKDPKWRQFWEEILASYNDLANKEWTFIHEFTRLMPTGLDRELGIIDRQLQNDLDTIIRKNYNYDKYVHLQKERYKLIQTQRKRKLLSKEKSKLLKIEKELSQYDLKLLYIEMRKLGYTQKDLHTAK